MEIKRPKFYLDKSGTYGEVLVTTDSLREVKGRRRYYVEVFLRGNKLLVCNSEIMHLQLLAGTGNLDEMEVINEALVQLDTFRSLMLMGTEGQWVVVVDGQKMPFVPGMEFTVNNNDFFIAVPYIQPKRTKFEGRFVIRKTDENGEGYF